MEFKEGDLVNICAWGESCVDVYFSMCYLMPYKAGHLVCSSQDIKNREIWYVKKVEHHVESIEVSLEEIANWKGVPKSKIIIKD